MEQKAYPSDVSEAEGALVSTYLVLTAEDVRHRDHPLCEVSNDFHFTMLKNIAEILA